MGRADYDTGRESIVQITRSRCYQQSNEPWADVLNHVLDFGNEGGTASPALRTELCVYWGD